MCLPTAKNVSRFWQTPWSAYRLEFWKVFGLFFSFGFCLMAVIVHIAPHAIDIGKSSAVAAVLVSLIGISSIAGKILLGGLGDLIGSKKIYIISLCIMNASVLFRISTKLTLLLYFFAIMFGLAYGGNASSQSPSQRRYSG